MKKINSDAIELKIGGVKCDNVKCDFINNDVKIEEYRSYLNAPCPKCGKNLLTQKDYDMVLFINKSVKVFNNILRPFCFIKRLIFGRSKNITEGTIKFNGTGELDIDIKEQK